MPRRAHSGLSSDRRRSAAPGPANLIALTAALPLWSYHVAFVSPPFANVLAVVMVMVGLGTAVNSVVTTHRVRVGHFAYFLFALFCEGFAPYSRTPLFWIAIGTATLLALLSHDLRDYSETLIPSDLGVTLQVATIPPIYYSLVSGSPPSVALASLMLVILVAGLSYDLVTLMRSRGVRLLCIAQILTILSLVVTVLAPVGRVALVIIITRLPPVAYLLALHLVYADGPRGLADTHLNSRRALDK